MYPIISDCACHFLFIQTFVCVSFYLPAHQSVHPFVCLSIHASFYSSILLSTHSPLDFTPLTIQKKQSDEFTRRGDSWWGFSHPSFFQPVLIFLHLPSLPPLCSPTALPPPTGELQEWKWDGSWGLETGVTCLVTAWVQGQMKAWALSKVQGSPKSKLMDSLTCRGWNQLKYIKSRIHAFSEWQIYAGNWERRREKNVFDLLETGCSFCQGNQAWSEMRSWWIITASQPP